MDDVQLANASDDNFWPPTVRTEAQSREVAALSDAWMFDFLGSRLQAFSAGLDRVVVVCKATPAFDAWALGPKTPGIVGMPSVWSNIPAGWEPMPPTMCFTQVVRVARTYDEDTVAGVLYSNADEDPPTDSRVDVVGAPSATEEAVATIREWLGLPDTIIEKATGVSRTTLWRMRAGKTASTRPGTDGPVWRLYALAAALVDSLGADGARGWLHHGEPSPKSLLESGRLSEVERLANRMLFIDTPTRGFAGVDDADYETAKPEITGGSASPRRPKRPRKAPKLQ